jgi:hypothetical protein
MSEESNNSNSNSNSDSNSDSFVNQITLQYLMNKNQYNNYIEKKTAKSISKREIKFYSQRFIKLTKKLLFKRKSVEDMPCDVKIAFNNYLKTCLQHFKMVDHTDLVQAEYDKESEQECEEQECEEQECEEQECEEQECEVENNDQENNEVEVEVEENNEVEVEEIEELNDEKFMHSLKVKMENAYLDKFVKTTDTNSDTMFIPQQKNISTEKINKLKKKKI